MNPVLKYSLIIRFLLTPLLVFTKNNVLYTILTLVFLDIIDCNPLIVKLFPKEYEKQKYCSLDETYEFFDKILDAFQNLIAILLIKPIIEKNIYYNLLLFLVFRIIGIILYYLTKINQTYILFFEFIKEYLVLYLIFGSNIPNIYLILSIFLKIIYEYSMHHKHIALTMYKYFFETSIL